MKISIFCILFCLVSKFCISQNPISTDTTITKTIRVGDSFVLGFENSPGSGYVWNISENYDTTQVIIKLLKEELVQGHQLKGGNYISSYVFTVLNKGTFHIEYSYSRPWLKEKLRSCNLKIIAE